MDRLIVLTRCDDNTCCCLSPRSTTALISVIGLVACLLDVLSNDSSSELICGAREHVVSLRNLLNTLFQMANMLLLLGSIVESALLLQIYLWYMLGFIVIGFVVAILEFCFRLRDEGAWSFATFVPEVVFLFGGTLSMTFPDASSASALYSLHFATSTILLHSPIPPGEAVQAVRANNTLFSGVCP